MMRVRFVLGVDKLSASPVPVISHEIDARNHTAWTQYMLSSSGLDDAETVLRESGTPIHMKFADRIQ